MFITLKSLVGQTIRVSITISATNSIIAIYPALHVFTMHNKLLQFSKKIDYFHDKYPIMETPIYKIVAIDNSGSTSGCKAYWTAVVSLMDDNSNTKYILWNSNARYVSFDNVLDIARTCHGTGCTKPQKIAQLIKRQPLSQVHLILITDGQVLSNDVEETDKCLKSAQFARVDVYFINTGGEIDLSVAMPFVRKTKYQLYKDGILIQKGVSAEPVNLKKYYGKPQEFLTESDDLYQKIVMQNLGRGNPKLRQDLLNLQSNLMKTIAQANAGKFDQKFGPLRTLLENDKYNEAIQMVKQLGNSSSTGLAKDVEAVIRDMIKHCEMTTDFGFNQLHSQRLARADNVETITTEELPQEINTSNDFECPIMMDNDNTPVIAIVDGQHIFSGDDKRGDECLTNPLALLKYPDLRERVRERLDHPIGLQAMQEMFSRKQFNSAITRKPIIGGMAFGTHPTHIKSVNWSMANIFFGTKLVGQPELWFAVIYFIALDIPYLATNSGLIKAMETHLLHRMRTKTSNITLTGLPIAPIMKAPVDISIWHCIVSPHIWDSPAQNRLLAFGATTKYLIRLLDLIGFPYPRDWTIKRCTIYGALAWMMFEEQTTCGSDLVKPWQNLLRAQYQGSITLSDRTIIMIDGPARIASLATPNKPKMPTFQLLDGSALDLGELLSVSKLVDRSKKISAIKIPDPLPGIQVPAAIKNYGYPDGLTNEAAIGNTKICPATMRPYTMDLVQKKHWIACSEKIYGPLDKQLSTFNYFLKFIKDKNRYPANKEEFIKFLARRQLCKVDEHGNPTPINTLPKQILWFADDVWNSYELVLGKNFADVSVERFNHLVKCSMDEFERSHLDGSA